MLSSVSCQIYRVQSLLSVRTFPPAVTVTSKLKVLPVHSDEDSNDGRVSGCLCRCAAAACVRRERSYRSAHFRYNKGNTPPKGGISEVSKKAPWMRCCEAATHVQRNRRFRPARFRYLTVTFMIFLTPSGAITYTLQLPLLTAVILPELLTLATELSVVLYLSHFE